VITITAATSHISYSCEYRSEGNGPFGTKQEIQMEKFDEPAIDEMTVDELDVVSGGTLRTEKIHTDYNNLNNFNDPTAVRIA
jgi:hypothetical protein